MKFPILHLDVETRSTIDLTKTGMYAYAEHPTTDVWVVCWSIGDSPVQVWYPGQQCPFAIRQHVRKAWPVYAHNAMFEYNIWLQILTPRHGWPEPPPHDAWHCTAAMAAAMALPRDLARACIALGLDTQKDMAGRRLMLQMARPRRYENGLPVWWNVPEKLARLTAYCKADVLAEKGVAARVRPLRPLERKVWLLDCLINARGIAIDRVALSHALDISRRVMGRFNDELCRLTRNQVTSFSQAERLKDWLREQGVDTDSIDKANMRAILNRDIPPAARKVLELRQEAAKSSTAKLTAFLERCCRDGRIRENLMYHGASTGRWAGKGVQPQNLPDPNRVGISQSTIDTAFELLEMRDPDLLEMVCGSVMTVLSCLIRGIIVAREGHKLVSADFANIEGRVLAWLAGDTKKLAAFAAFDAGTGPDLYKVAASGIYNVPIATVDKLQRTVGKTAELACGYQGGVNAFHSMAKGYNVDMAVAYPGLWERQDEDSRASLEERYDAYVKAGRKDELQLNPDTDGLDSVLSREVWMASEITKQLWRAANPKIAAVWPQLEDAALEAVRERGKIVSACAGKVRFRVHNNILWLQLPSGRCLAYMDPKELPVKTPWGAMKQSVTFMGVHPKTKQWTRQKSYGGLWSENITQAIARDLLAEAMIRVEESGYPVVLSVHDELVSEVPENFGSVEEYQAIMTALPPWAHGCPVVAEGWEDKRYRK